MKEPYFTPDNIALKTQQMLQEIKPLVKNSKLKIAPKGHALLVLDMQDYFLDKDSHAFIPSALAILPQIKRLIKAFSHHNLPVIFTRHLNTPADAQMMGRWWKDLITEDNPQSKVTAELYDPSLTVINKTQYDAFYKTSLEELLRKDHIKQLTITGVMTHLCCETTARSAFIRGFEVLFPVDGTATYNEKFHRATLLNLAHGFALPVMAEEIAEGLRK